MWFKAGCGWWPVGDIEFRRGNHRVSRGHHTLVQCLGQLWGKQWVTRSASKHTRTATWCGDDDKGLNLNLSTREYFIQVCDSTAYVHTLCCLQNSGSKCHRFAKARLQGALFYGSLQVGAEEFVIRTIKACQVFKFVADHCGWHIVRYKAGKEQQQTFLFALEVKALTTGQFLLEGRRNALKREKCHGTTSQCNATVCCCGFLTHLKSAGSIYRLG